VSLGLFVATNLLAATSQRRYAIKRTWCLLAAAIPVAQASTTIPRFARDDKSIVSITFQLAE
jgi:hypothetical protein